MITIQLHIDKSKVYDEVAKTTSYQAAKKVGDETAYDRIFTTDEDRIMLDRFWTESCAVASDLMKSYITNVSNQADSSADYDITLELSSGYDINLTDSVSSSLFSFFVSNISSKWCAIADKEESKAYADDALAHLTDIKSKIYYRKKPMRVNIN